MGVGNGESKSGRSGGAGEDKESRIFICLVCNGVLTAARQRAWHESDAHDQHCRGGESEAINGW
jgi:hypothetical protein